MASGRGFWRSPLFPALVIVLGAILIRLFWITTYSSPRDAGASGLPEGRLFVVSKRADIQPGNLIIYRFADPSESYPTHHYSLARCIAAPGAQFGSYPAPRAGEILTLDSTLRVDLAHLLMQEISPKSLLQQPLEQIRITHDYYLCLKPEGPFPNVETLSMKDLFWIRVEDVRGKVIGTLRYPF